MQKAKVLEVEKNKELIYTIADLYAEKAGDEKLSYFKSIKQNFSGYDLMGYSSIYGKFLNRTQNPEIAIDGAKDLTVIANTDNKYIKYTALKVLKDNVIKPWQEKETVLNDAVTKSLGEVAIQFTNELKTVTETKNKLVELYNSAIK